MFDKCEPCPVRGQKIDCHAQTTDSPGLCIQYAQGVYHANVIIRLSSKGVKPGVPAQPPFPRADIPGTSNPGA
jgi:hypothetical protein